MSRDQRTSFSLGERLSSSEGNFYIERNLATQGFSAVAGVDEAGRGPLAGPVVAGCVLLPPEIDHSRLIDSKKLTARQREKLYGILHASKAHIGVGIASAREIEKINILQASLKAMERAVRNCLPDSLPDFLLVDGTFSVPLNIPQQTLVKGESKSASVAAASIIAKVTRDQLMAKAHERFPQYNFLKNQGYPTREHRLAIQELGPCEYHRRTFKGVREFANDLNDQTANLRQQSLWPL